MDYKNQFVAVETAQCSVCNLDCVYCYIPKNKALSSINKEWSNVYKNNTYYELLSEKFPIDQLESISFWGAEPSLGFNDFKDVETLIKRFPAVSSFSTSSNFTTLVGHKYIIKKLDKYAKETGRRLSFDLQVSIDGTEVETDKNRGKSTYGKIIKNLKEFIDYTIDLENTSIRIHPKSTNTSDDFKDFASHETKLSDYLQSFENLDNEFREKIKGRNNITGHFKTLPTLALPGDYTKSDGENFYKYHLVLDKLLEEKFTSWSNQNEQYYDRLFSLIQSGVFINRRDGNKMFSCGAGKTMLSIDPDGSTHGCHGSFWYNYEEYLDSIKGQVDWCEGERIIEFERDKFWEINKALISGYRDDFNESRRNYMTQSFVYHITNYINITYGTVKALLLANQISPIYKDESWAKIFTLFIALKSSCWYNNYVTSGALSITPLSIYRMYGNGMFEYIAKKLAKSLSL